MEHELRIKFRDGKEVLPELRELERGTWTCVAYTDGRGDGAWSYMQHPALGVVKVNGAYTLHALYDVGSIERHNVLPLRIGQRGDARATLEGDIKRAKFAAASMLVDAEALGFEGEYELRISLVPTERVCHG